MKSTISPKPFRNFVWRSMCFSFLRPLSRNAGSASWIFRTGVIWHGTPTKQTFLRPMRSASASARLFGQ